MCESTVVIPALVLLIMGVVDLARMYMTAYKVSAVTYEGSRYASTIEDLEKDVTIRSDYFTTTSLPPTHRHTAVHHRMRLLLQKSGALSDSDLGSDAYMMGSHVYKPLDSQDYEIKIEIKVPFRPILLKGFTEIETHAQMPYLFTG